jgi:hypothetical protein
MKTEIVQVNQEIIGKETAAALKNAFEPFFKQASEWAAQAKMIVVKNIDQKEEMSKAKEFRLRIKKVRTTLENKRVELKQESLRKSQAIDGIAKQFKELVEPIETHLKEQEDFAINHLRKIREERVEKRKAILAKYEDDAESIDLGNMTEDAFKKYHDGVKLSYETQQAKLKKEEEDRIRAEEEAKKLEVRNNKRIMEVSSIGLIWNNNTQSFVFEDVNISIVELKTDPDDVFEKKLGNCKQVVEKRKEEQKKIQEENKILQEKLEKKQAEEKEKQEAEKLAKQKEDSAPDKEKLITLISDIKSIKIPELKNPLGTQATKGVNILLNKVVKYIEEKISQM